MIIPRRHVKADGIIEWTNNGKLHRYDGPARVEPDGTEYWYQNDKLHRIDGPAVILPNGDEYWYRRGLLHREDGPAIVNHVGVDLGFHVWCYKGIRVRSKVQYQIMTGIKSDELTLLILKYGDIV